MKFVRRVCSLVTNTERKRRHFVESLSFRNDHFWWTSIIPDEISVSTLTTILNHWERYISCFLITFLVNNIHRLVYSSYSPCFLRDMNWLAYIHLFPMNPCMLSSCFASQVSGDHEMQMNSPDHFLKAKPSHVLCRLSHGLTFVCHLYLICLLQEQ